ncbi:lysophosphatidic acid receptor 6-like [Archocentrus centrarchus]|uniref:lysophosphatidic acid receptor 6-like n=1 Tax=Archocentrus centrarchus TaxID=63155 RepID=UPI0011E9B475|nr:lysophosphatidic acid receptor 6-like [Archocentrus centrarchus]
MNMSDATRVDPAYAGVFGCIMVIGLPLNVASLWILLRRHSLKSPNAVFMVNLAISDLLLVFTLPMRVYFNATGKWTLPNEVCLIITMFFRTNIRSSASFITFISMDRLLAVVYPLRSRHLRTSSNAWKGAALIWLILLVVNIPESVDFLKHLNNHTAVTNQYKCFESYDANDCPLKGTRLGVIHFQIVILVTMLSVNLVCTVMVFRALHRHLSGDSAMFNNKMNVMLIFAINLFLYAIFLPVPIAMATNCAHVKPLVCLTVLNCCLDPLLYYFSFDSFWKKKEDVVVKMEGLLQT